MAGISIKFPKDKKWLADEIEKLRKEQNRPSTNNMVIQILVEYFNERKKSITPTLKGRGLSREA